MTNDQPDVSWLVGLVTPKDILTAMGVGPQYVGVDGNHEMEIFTPSDLQSIRSWAGPLLERSAEAAVRVVRKPIVRQTSYDTAHDTLSHFVAVRNKFARRAWKIIAAKQVV